MTTTTNDLYPIIRHPDGYWIEPADAVAEERIGPYRTRAEAEIDRRGVVRFLRKLDRGENPFE